MNVENEDGRYEHKDNNEKLRKGKGKIWPVGDVGVKVMVTMLLILHSLPSFYLGALSHS